MKSGIDQSLFNKNIRPQDDLYRFANGAWLSTAKIPDDRATAEEARLRIATDPHSPDEHRCNQIVRNLNEFYGAFQVKESDALYLKERVRIW